MVKFNEWINERLATANHQCRRTLIYNCFAEAVASQTRAIAALPEYSGQVFVDLPIEVPTHVDPV